MNEMNGLIIGDESTFKAYFLNSIGIIVLLGSIWGGCWYSGNFEDVHWAKVPVLFTSWFLGLGGFIHAVGRLDLEFIDENPDSY